MALSRRTGQRFQASIWPGFVDAMTGLLLVLMFVLTIFMVVQFVLRETITGQATRLDKLSAEIVALSEALGLEQDRNATLSERVGTLTTTLGEARQRAAAQVARIAELEGLVAGQADDLAAAATRIASFEEQVAGLLAEREGNLGTIADLEERRDELLSRQEQLQLALAGMREEVDAQSEAARLAAAKREALEALIADLEAKNAQADATQGALTAKVEDLEAQLSEEEASRLAEAAAAEALRERLKGADAELSAMTLALEAERKRAEETLTLLAAAETVRDDLNARLAAALVAAEEGAAELETMKSAQADQQSLQEQLAAREAELAQLRERLAAVTADAEDLSLTEEELRDKLAAALAAKIAAEQEAETQLSEAEARALLLAQAREALSEQEAMTEAARREQALLNQQVQALRTQLGELQALLDDAVDRESSSSVQLQTLGKDLNVALARLAAEEKRRRELQEEKAKLLEAQKQDLEKYRSEFFGRLRDVLGAQDGVRIEGDRFVFSSEVLFAPGRAALSAEGRGEVAKVAEILRKVAGDIPPELDWVIRVDGHTDDVPIVNSAEFADNWELSQARALSVVRYMIESLGIPPDRLSANGFGQYQPVAQGDSAEARAQNRRIELKFTEK